MGFVDRVGAALVAPRRALADAEAGRGGLPDAVLLLVLKLVCTETQALVVGLWSFVAVGPVVALRALLAHLSGALGTDLVLLVAGGAAVTLLAGRRRNPSRDFDLAAVAWIPVLAVDTIASLAARLAGVEVGPRAAAALWLVALGWMALVLVLAVATARGRR
jgi:hypothetical protein